MFFFISKFCLLPKWQSFIEICQNIYDHPQEYLAKSGCKPKIKYKSFNHLSICLATQWIPHIWIWQYLIFFLLTLVTENLQNQFYIIYLLFQFLAIYHPLKKKRKRLLTCWVPIINYIEYLTINIWNPKNSKFLNVSLTSNPD